MMKTMRNKIIKITSDLIRFRSTSKNLNELDNIVCFVENYFSGKNLFIKRYKKNGKHSIIITTEDTKNPKIFLVGHLDVVEASVKDFNPVVKKGRLYGRGSADMKGNVAIMMLLLKYFSEQNTKLRAELSLGLMLTTDEEVGSENGVEYLLKNKKFGVNSKIVIFPDAGENILNIINKIKGVLHLKISAKGKSAHGSKVWMGNNALDKLINGYSKVKKIFPVINTKNLWKPTLNLGIMKGGNAINQVPNYAEAFLDIRITEKENASKVISDIKKVFKGCNVEVLAKGNTFCIQNNNVYMKKYRDAVKKVLNKKIKFIYEHGSLDARFFAEKNTPVIISQPTCGNIHGENEWIDIKSMEDYYRILVEFIKSIEFKK